MTKSIFFWASCIVFLFIIFLTYQYLSSPGNVLSPLKFRIIFSLFVFTAVISFFYRNTPITKGIVLGVFVAIIINFNFNDGLSFDISRMADDPFGLPLGLYIVQLSIFPVISLIISLVFFKKRNFELAKIFAFVTVAIFASFFLGQLLRVIFSDPDDGALFSFINQMLSLFVS